jgi:heme/copper-type cytochrome/quinol oxidase subunit 3
MLKGKKGHPYHLVNPSPWPIVGSLASLVITVGAVLYMRHHGIATLLIGLGLLVSTMIGWWHDIIKESKKEHTSVVKQGFRYGIALFIASEIMFFAAFFWAFFDASLFPKAATGFIWPPKGLKTLDPFDLPYLNTLLLLLSGTTITWAHHSLLENDRRSTLLQIFYTILLGIIFLCVQLYEYYHAPFAFKGGIYPSTFFMATGFHGFHVFVGVIFLIVTWTRTYRGHFKPDDHFGFEAAAWYWHFVDVVWLFLFVSIYWWGGGAAG